MQQIDWSRMDYGILLLVFLAFLYLYLLPTLIALQRGHHRFWVILALNIPLMIVQSALLQYLSPVNPQGLPPAEILWVAFLYCMGPGWVALLVWALRPVNSPDPRLIAFRGTKMADLLGGLPLLAWFAFSALSQRAFLVHDISTLIAGQGGLVVLLRVLSLIFSILFCLLTVWLLLVRDTAVKRIGGVLPRLCAVGGTFLGVAMLRLPVAELGLPLQALSFLLTGLGGLSSFLVLSKLGKSFSIVPEARKLVTTGPYAWARHPLYAAEIVTLLGVMILYQQPWATLMGLGVIALQITRSIFEERLLIEAFPEYVAYRARVKRFGFI
ncbi:MAG: isoprenylcysteine carboxylmethyltransferase family protein [Alphaproteobacteria bacterium]|nr:isoprenylcysteine carboxylmethyltransferase family protein [Alphaproteobacteria bacterium]